jgi:hypothetical protein
MATPRTTVRSSFWATQKPVLTMAETGPAGSGSEDPARPAGDIRSTTKQRGLIAGGYGNPRVIFDSETGARKRRWDLRRTPSDDKTRL